MTGLTAALVAMTVDYVPNRSNRRVADVAAKTSPGNTRIRHSSISDVCVLDVHVDLPHRQHLLDHDFC